MSVGKWVLLAAAAIAAGCGGGGDGAAKSTEAPGREPCETRGNCAPPEEPEPGCTAVAEEIRAEIGASHRLGLGDRLELGIAAAGLDAWSVAALTGGWRVLAEEADRLVLRAPWSQPGTGTLALRLVCGAKAATLEVALEAAPLRWSSLASWAAGEGPPGREYFAWWIDPQDPDRALLFGGFHYVPRQYTVGSDFWSLDLATGAWTELPTPENAPGLAGGAVAPAPDGGRSVLWYRGLAISLTTTTLPFELAWLDYSTDTPAFEDAPVQGAPRNGTYQPILVWDEPRARYVILCGQGMLGPSCAARTWDPATGAWASLRTEGAVPPGRSGAAWVHDTVNQRVILFSGEKGGGESAEDCDCDDETWALELAEDPPRWVRLETARAPEPRRNGAFAYDPVGQRMLIWSGATDGFSSPAGIEALELTRGHEDWHAIPVAGGPRERGSPGALYDPVRRRILFGFGNDNRRVYTDLHALELAP